MLSVGDLLVLLVFFSARFFVSALPAKAASLCRCPSGFMSLMGREMEVSSFSMLDKASSLLSSFELEGSFLNDSVLLGFLSKAVGFSSNPLGDGVLPLVRFSDLLSILTCILLDVGVLFGDFSVFLLASLTGGFPAFPFVLLPSLNCSDLLLFPATGGAVSNSWNELFCSSGLRIFCTLALQVPTVLLPTVSLPNVALSTSVSATVYSS
mmetsp:Transcript_18805/g.39425  ORF Transcript_18805/g.39425 Transcript_18805/m.39425 type:complete len:209 (-) Transcript_18805:1611-2237(-)